MSEKTYSTLAYSTQPYWGGYAPITKRPEVLQRMTYISSDKSGSKNPGWRDAVERRANATSPYSATFTELSVIPWTYDAAFQKPGASRYEEGMTSDENFVRSLPPERPYLLSLARNKAYSQAAGNVRSALQAFAGPTFLGELRDTVRMIKRPTQGVINLTINYNRQVARIKRLYKGSDLTQHLSKAWLTYAFGIRPLGADLHAAVEAYKRKLNEGPPQTITGSASESDSVSSSGVFSVVGYGKATFAHTQTWEVGCRVKLSLSRSVSAPDIRSLAGIAEKLRHFGLGDTRELAMAVWEVIPFSFLIDYVASVGDLLEQSYLSHGSIAWSSVTTKETRTTTSVITPYGVAPGYGWTMPSDNSSSGMSINRQTRYNRTPDFPGQALIFEMPSLSQGWNVVNLINALRKSLS